jgi:EF hand
MMIPRTILYAASAFAVAIAAGACGQKATMASGGQGSTGQPWASAQGFSPGSFEALDVDRDGGIAMWEAQADPSLVARFGELDRNGDGKLDRAEYSAAKPTGIVKAAGG